MSGDSSSRSLLPIIEACDNFPYDAASEQSYYKLFLPGDDEPHGYLLPETVRKMPWTARFRVTHERPRSVAVLDSSGGSDTPGAVNAALAELVDRCVDGNLFHVLDGQHSEPFAIPGAPYPVTIERFASSLFGITARGACLTAYARSPSPSGGADDAEDATHLWIARRAAHLYSFPGLLDATVAGGIKAGTSPLATLIAEADEEASLPPGLVRARARPAGVLTYVSVTGAAAGFPGEKGLVVPDALYVYDCELPAGVVPAPHDDEVEGFRRMSAREVRAALLAGEFKPDAAAVLVDFLVRHGFVSAEEEPNFVEINMRLHRRLPFKVVAAPGGL